jgi:hypothetical protein
MKLSGASGSCLNLVDERIESLSGVSVTTPQSFQRDYLQVPPETYRSFNCQRVSH